MNTEPKITVDQAKAIVDTKTAPRVTEESIKARIADVTYYRFDTLTLCIITMLNGFKSIGKSVPASKANFDAQVGERYAYEDAFKPLWQLEAYLLLEQMNKTSSFVSAIPPKKQRKPRTVKAVQTKPIAEALAKVPVPAEPEKAESPAAKPDARPFPWTDRQAQPAA